MTEDFSRTILRRAFVKSVLRKIFALGLIVGIVYGLVAMVYATKTIYKVKMNYAMVLEKFGGQRVPVTEQGWHIRLPFFTKIEQEVPLMNQAMFLSGQTEPNRIIPRKTWPLLKIWAIENLDPMNLLHSHTFMDSTKNGTYWDWKRNGPSRRPASRWLHPKRFGPGALGR